MRIMVVMYKKLSEQVAELSNAQRSDTFVRLFREGVRSGDIKAVFLPGERFELPKLYARRHSRESYKRDARDMLFEYTDKFEQWFEGVNRDLAVSRRGGSIKVTEENIQAGFLDFDALAEETRAKMAASHAKGHALGVARSRRGAGAKTKAAPKAPSPKAARTGRKSQS